MKDVMLGLCSWALTLLAGILFGHAVDFGSQLVYDVLTVAVVVGCIVHLVLGLRTPKKGQSQ